MLREISKSEVDSICIYLLEENVSYNYEMFKELSKIDSLFNIYVFNSNCSLEGVPDYLLFKIKEVNMSFLDYSKNVFPGKFNINTDLFFEANNFNPYYNGKLYIDELGQVKNGLFTEKVFGNINKLRIGDLISVVNSDSFRFLWNANKKDTLVCCQCEFRFMCIDSRNTFKAESSLWIHDSECNYNPYISTWKYEEGYINLLETGIDIDLYKGSIKVNETKIKKAFSNVWK